MADKGIRFGATAFVPGMPDSGRVGKIPPFHPKKWGIIYGIWKTLSKIRLSPFGLWAFRTGLIHCRIGFDLKTDAGIKKYKEFTVEASELVVSYGGSLSGEHGDGQSRGELLHKMYGDTIMEAFQNSKNLGSRLENESR